MIIIYEIKEFFKLYWKHYFILFGIMTLITMLCSCENIRHKTLRIISSGTGGKMSVADPSGSGTPTPIITIGAYSSSITTIPVGSKAKYSAKTYELFSGRVLFEEKMDITTTDNNIKITDLEAIVKKTKSTERRVNYPIDKSRGI